jgi:hypothetical protein
MRVGAAWGLLAGPARGRGGRPDMLDALDLEDRPGPGDVELARGRRRHRLVQQQLGDEGADAQGRVQGRPGQAGAGGVELGHGDDAQVLRLLPQVGAAVDEHRRLHAEHAQVAGARDAAGQRDVALDAVEGHALLEHVAEVEQQPARQGLQAEHAEQARDARLGVQETALAERHRELAAQLRHLGRAASRARRVHPRCAPARPAGPCRRPGARRSAAVGEAQVEGQGTALPGRPQAARQQRGLGHGQAQAVELPLERALARATAGGGSRPHLELAQGQAAPVEVVHHQRQGRHLRGSCRRPGSSAAASASGTPGASGGRRPPGCAASRGCCHSIQPSPWVALPSARQVLSATRARRCRTTDTASRRDRRAQLRPARRCATATAGRPAGRPRPAGPGSAATAATGARRRGPAAPGSTRRRCPRSAARAPRRRPRCRSCRAAAAPRRRRSAGPGAPAAHRRCRAAAGRRRRR